MICQGACVGASRNHLITAEQRRSGKSAHVLSDAKKNDEADKILATHAQHAKEAENEGGANEEGCSESEQGLTEIKLRGACEIGCVGVDPGSKRDDKSRDHHLPA